MALPEYEKIARSKRNKSTSAPANLAVIEESVATDEVAVLYDYFRTHFGRPDVPGILKCFATHPPLLRHMMVISETLIFTDGALRRKDKEMIATLVSAQNSCPYCVDSHAFFLRMHGGSAGALAAIQANDLKSLELTQSEQALLRFVRKVNSNSHEVNAEDIALMKKAGWSELQIAEAIHITALFASFNRVANSFGLSSQGLLALYDDVELSGGDKPSNGRRNA
jgi:uncharacterized peroxidase-related enzyme